LSDDLNEDNLKEIFESIDTDGKGEVDSNSFGQAILSTLKPAE